MQPIVGLASDVKDTRFGKRKPFILVGTILAIIGLFFFGNSQFAGEVLGDSGTDHQKGIIIAIVSLWLINIGLNTIQAPAIALMLDMCKNKESVNRGTSVITATSAAASLVAYGLGFLRLDELKIFSSNEQGLFYICIVLMVITTVITLATTKETSAPSVLSEEKEEKVSAVRQFVNGIVYMKMPVIRIMLLYFFASAAASPLNFFFSNSFLTNSPIYFSNCLPKADYVGEDVYHGSQT